MYARNKNFTIVLLVFKFTARIPKTVVFEKLIRTVVEAFKPIGVQEIDYNDIKRVKFVLIHRCLNHDVKSASQPTKEV